jgi:hypothetical protein
MGGRRCELFGAVVVEPDSMQRHLALALALWLASAPAGAQDANPIDSAACRRAVDTLTAREAAAASDRASTAARGAVTAAQRQAALACLGGPDVAASTPQRASPAPLLGTPAAVLPRLPVTPPPPPAPRALPAPRAAPPPLTLNACDATGCWASDGTRLQRAGPNLLGPRGICTTSGPFVQCP